MSEWFAYDWELHGTPARFRVDLQFAERSGEWSGYTTLLYVSCAPRRTGASALSFWERRRLAPTLRRCSSLLGEQSRYVGAIELPAQIRYYFYTSDARLLVPLYEFCSRESALRLECSKAEEPGQQTYFQFLYPDAAKRQSAANRDLIADRRARGDETDAPRRVDLTFLFPSAQCRAGFSAAAAALGFVAGRAGFDETQEAPYTLTLHAVVPLAHRPLTELTTRAITAAAPYYGVFARLDAAFLPKDRPK